MALDEADFVIVGGGTAGCVLANRLSAEPACRVVLLEAGDEDTSPWIHMPAGIAKLYFHPRLNWGYRTVPEPTLGGRRLYWPRGRVLGGTSSINGMTFVRGQIADYDAWAPLTGGAWSWTSVLPYFKRMEDSPIGDPVFRGRGGPLRIGALASPHPLSTAFLASSEAAGIAINEDYNGAAQEGIAFTQVMMRDGVRSSAATAYLAPVRARANLQVLTRGLVRRIVIESGRAAGVEFDRDGRRQAFRARREVVLCAGTVASPQILMLSGIGDARTLSALGIPVIADRPAVGRNMQEHVRAPLLYRTRSASLNQEARGARLARHLANYLFHKSGLLTNTASQVNGFVRSSPDVDRPDLQIVFRPSSGDYRDGRFVVHDYPGVMAMASLLRPRSRGQVSVHSADPNAAPVIVAGHFSDMADYVPLIRGVDLMRRIAATPPFAQEVLEEVRPSMQVRGDAELRDYLRDNAESLFHAVGTCAMGLDPASVTSPELRVRGVNDLRVVDASVMPLIPSANTAAAVIMIAERAADMLQGRKLPGEA
jgi:choline dehydrogenase